jgi:P-type Ca2+ transporter type 2C
MPDTVKKPREDHNPSLLDAKETLSYLQTSEEGLSERDVVDRIKMYGRNELHVTKSISPLSLYLNQFKNTLTIILIGSVLLILFIYFAGKQDPADLLEAGLITAIILMITLVGFVQEYKAEKAIESLKKLMAYKAKVRRMGEEKEIAVSMLVPGDIVLLEEGMKVPADIRLLDVVSLQVNEASLTGESTPVSKSTEPLLEHKEISEQSNMLFSGTVIVSGRGTGVVTGTGNATQIGEIAKDVADVRDEATPMQQRLNEIGRTIGYIILGICSIVFIFIVFLSADAATLTLTERLVAAFIAAVALAVAAIPEGLPAVVTVALALGTQRMLKRNVLVRKLSAVETLGSTDVICSDKTGTLTKGEMTVQKLYCGKTTYEVSGTGYDLSGVFSKNGKPVDAKELFDVLLCGMVCNNARLNDDKTVSGDPTEVALLIAARKAQIKTAVKRVFELPFTSERKMMSVVVVYEGKYMLFAKGAPEVVLSKCTKIKQGKECRPLTKTDEKDVLTITHDFSSQALRNLGFAYKELTKTEFSRLQQEDIERDLVFLGVQGMIDPPREEVAPLITQCQDAGIRILMITGDHIETAKAIARSIGIQGDAVEGKRIDDCTEKEFDELVEVVNIYARVNPNTKMKVVEALQKKGHIVAMTGDGVNDAPALKKANIGIAMGITGTDVAKEAADMVLMDDKFSTLIAAVEEGRGIFHNIQKFVTYLLTCNIAEVLVVLFGLLIFKEVPLSATMLLWINVVTDGIPAVALSLDPAERGIMRYSPAYFQKQVISKKMWLEMIAFGFVLSVAVLTLYALHYYRGVAAAATAAFHAIVFFEIMYLFIIRSGYQISFFSNKWLHVSILFTMLLQLMLISVPIVSGVFGLTPMTMNVWAYILLACLDLLIAFLLFQRLLHRYLR